MAEPARVEPTTVTSAILGTNFRPHLGTFAHTEPRFPVRRFGKEAVPRIAKIVSFAMSVGVVLVIAGAGVVLPSKLAIAKSKVTVKMSPEFTGHKKGGGTTDAATTSSAQTAGKRDYSKDAQSLKPRLAPDKVEARHENIRR